MKLKSSDWVMFGVMGAAILLILVWAFVPKEESTQFIDTKSIQIDTSS